jgi:hypothetical protein
MSASSIPTVYNMGVKRLTTLGGLGALSDVAQGMISEGYNAGIINNLVQAGATDAQLQYLWDNYSPSLDANDPSGFGLPAVRLQAQLSQVPTGTQFQNALKATGAIPVGLPWNITPPAQTYAASSPAGMVNLPPGAPPTDWTSWLQSNAGKILLVVALVAIVPPLVKKL